MSTMSTNVKPAGDWSFRFVRYLLPWEGRFWIDAFSRWDMVVRVKKVTQSLGEMGKSRNLKMKPYRVSCWVPRRILRYTPEDSHGIWKWSFLKGIFYFRVPFSGSMLNFGRVQLTNVCCRTFLLDPSFSGKNETEDLLSNFAIVGHPRYHTTNDVLGESNPMLDTGWLIRDSYERRYHDPFWHRIAWFPQQNPLQQINFNEIFVFSKMNENDELRVEIGLRR